MRKLLSGREYREVSQNPSPRTWLKTIATKFALLRFSREQDRIGAMVETRSV
jgi:DNA-directed RNA polymerase specialized sigma24 family protein